MPTSHERSPHERETLIFSSPEAAQAWRESVGEHLREQAPGVRRDREIVGQALAKEFEAAGHGVAVITHPWEHTPAEHEEVQQLVDKAFAEDLPKALGVAKNSPHYPRNVDLFHDVLTSELYEHLKQNKVNRQPLTLWVTEIAVLVLAAVVGILVILVTIR